MIAIDASYLWLVVSFAFGLIGAFLIAKRGSHWGIMDSPNVRSSHRVPVPKGGGIGILAAFLIGAIWWQIPWALWLPAFGVSVVSLIGDCREISFKFRLVAQIVAAVVFSGYVFLWGSKLKLSVENAMIPFLLGALFIAAMANFYNFMDGINGIAGLAGVFAFSCLGLYGLYEGKDSAWVLTAFGLAAACLGFLLFNFPLAHVFMGDVGSVLLGYLFASWVLWYSKSLLEFIFLISLVFPFFADELSTLIVRIKDGDRLTKAHRRHVYQILVNQVGLSHTIVTLMYGIMQIMVVVLAFLMMKKGLVFLVGLLLFLSCLFFFGSLFIRRRWELDNSYSG